MPVKSFWESEDKIPIGQSSVVIESDNNLDHTAGQKVTFHIPSNLEFINPKETYLRFDVLLDIPSGHKTNLQLDCDIGAQSLLADVRLRTRDGKILSEIQGYNTLVSVMYDYNTNANLRQKRSLTEGATINNPLCGGTGGCYQTNKQDVLNNPYFKRETSTSKTDSSLAFKTAKCLLQIHNGIFQNDKVFPILLTGDLVLEIILEQNRKIFRQLDSVTKHRNVASNPHFLNTSGAEAQGTGTSGDSLTHFYVNPAKNSMNSMENFPFRIGERFKFVDLETFAVSDTGGITQDITSASDSGAASPDFIITGLHQETGAGTTQKVKVSVSSTSLSGSDIAQNSVMFSTEATQSGFDATYTLSNIELICQKLDMPTGYKSSLMNSMKSGGVMTYDFLDYTNYRFSTLSSESIINLRLPLQNSRAKAIWCVPTDASTISLGHNAAAHNTYYQMKDGSLGGGTALFSDRVSLEGCADFIQNYQFMYDNKLQPNRKVDVSKTGDKTAISQEGLIELEKALSMGGLEVRSFRKFNRNFVVGRALSLGKSGVYDTRGKDFNLQLEYNGANAQQVNKLWNCYCAHIRGLRISGSDVDVLL